MGDDFGVPLALQPGSFHNPQKDSRWKGYNTGLMRASEIPTPAPAADRYLTGIRPVRPRDHRKFQPSGFRPSTAHSTQRSHLWGGFQPPIASLPKPFPGGFRRIQNQSPVPFPAQPRTVRSGNGGLLGGSRKKIKYSRTFPQNSQ